MRLPPRAQAQSRLRATPRRFAPPCAWFVSTRAAVLLVAIFAALSFGPASGGLARENAAKFDDPALTHGLAEPLLAPLARWDSVWYLRIADSGYGESAPRAAFFPLYPLLVRALAHPIWGLGACTARGGIRRIAHRVSRGACAPLPADGARAGAEAGAPHAAPACGVPSRSCNSGCPIRRASSCCWRWCPSMRRVPSSGPGLGRAQG